MSNDSEIETFLRRFEPRAPAPLPSSVRRPARTWRFYALAAASAAAIVLLAWHLAVPPPFSSRAPGITQRLRPTLGTLNAALRAGNLDSVLDEMGKQTLPDPSRPGGALEALARDGALTGRPKGGFK
jgi:hypothetical protein